MSDLEREVEELRQANERLTAENLAGIARCLSLLEILGKQGTAEVDDLPALLRDLKATHERTSGNLSALYPKALAHAQELVVVRSQLAAAKEYIFALSETDRPELVARGARIILEHNPDWQRENRPTAG